MSEQTPPDSKRDSISIIYHQRNDSPKYFEISRTKMYLFFIGLPTLTLIGFLLGTIGLIHTSPFHLIENYKKSSSAREVYKNQEQTAEKLESTLTENAELKNELTALRESNSNTGSETGSTPSANLKCPSPTCTETLSPLSFFKPVASQKNRMKPAVLNLTGFKTAIQRDTVNLQFNIIPTVGGEAKISGHIVVLMKNELGISVYPAPALNGLDYQISYSSGEPFATQHFRPVDASFARPRKSGNYTFAIFIFSRTGDLLHHQTNTFSLKL